MEGLKLASDSDTEKGKKTTSRNIFDESAVCQRVSWGEWFRQECNKANASNIVTFLVTVAGLVLRIKLGKDDLFARCVLSAGLFGLAGGVTNAIAVKMLFDTIYVAPGVPLVGSGIIEQRFKDIRRTLKNTMMKSFFVLDYMKGYIEKAAARLPSELEGFLDSEDFESILSTALEKASQSESMKEVPEDMRPLCHILLRDLSAHLSNLESTSISADELPSVARFRPHLELAAQSAAPIIREQLPRIATSDSVLPILRREAEASIRSSIESQAQAMEPQGPGNSCFSCEGRGGRELTDVRIDLDGGVTLPQRPDTWSAQFFQKLGHSAADKAVGLVVNDDFPAKVHKAVSKLDVEQLLIAAANSEELTAAVDAYVRTKVGTSPSKADFFRRGFAALLQLLKDEPQPEPWPPEFPLWMAKNIVKSVFHAAVPQFQKNLPSLVTEPNVHRMRCQIDKLLEERLQGMSKRVVKRMVEDVMRVHCQWLIVWGNVFGGLIGVISTLCGY